jgi:hypothetical protein
MAGRLMGMVVVALSLAACGGEDARVRDNSSAVSLTDSQIAGVLVAASQDALAAARTVADRGGPEACDYGSQMMVMHGAAMDRLHALGVRPTPSEIGVVLDYDTKKVIAEIGKATGRVAVDLLYLCLQVRAQTTVAELPMQADMPALQNEVEETRRNASGHLAIAAARAIDVAAAAAGGLRSNSIGDVCGPYDGPGPGNGTGLPTGRVGY